MLRPADHLLKKGLAHDAKRIKNEKPDLHFDYAVKKKIFLMRQDISFINASLYTKLHRITKGVELSEV